MRRLAYLIISAVSGFSILALEFAAVRQMAPAFGQSAYVWANVIGVILVTLTIGYAVGGRLAERSTSGRPLFAACDQSGNRSTVPRACGPPLRVDQPSNGA